MAHRGIESDSVRRLLMIIRYEAGRAQKRRLEMNRKTGITIGVLAIGTGAAWLLNLKNVMGIDWVLSVLLGLGGILVLALSGFNKLSIVVGPLLMAGGVTSVLRQSGRLSGDLEIPVLLIVFGVLFLIAQFRFIPLPEFMKSDQEDSEAGR